MTIMIGLGIKLSQEDRWLKIIGSYFYKPLINKYMLQSVSTGVGKTIYFKALQAVYGSIKLYGATPSKPTLPVILSTPKS